METPTYYPENEAYDESIFSFIIKNNSGYKKRFHLSNYCSVKSAILSGTSECLPEYSALSDKGYHQKLEALDYLENNLLSNSLLHKTVVNLYKDKIREKKLLLNLVRSGFEAQTESRAGFVAARNFQALTEQVFGVPQLTIFNELLEKLRNDFLCLPDEIKATDSFFRFSALFPKSKNNEKSFESVQKDDGPYINSSEEVLIFFKQKMEALNLSSPWQVTISEAPIASFQVRLKRDFIQVLVPKTSVLRKRKMERKLTISVLEGIFAHEVLTHVMRTVRGRRSALKLLGVGLANYLSGEEGIATYREQRITGSHEYPGGTIYLALSLAYGLDRGGKKRSFTDVYDILCDYFRLKYQSGDISIKAKAFATCCRIFILSPHVESPLIFTRDLVYREGNIAITTLLAQAPEAEQNFDIGKYDPANKNHTQALRELGLL